MPEGVCWESERTAPTICPDVFPNTMMISSDTGPDTTKGWVRISTEPRRISLTYMVYCEFLGDGVEVGAIETPLTVRTYSPGRTPSNLNVPSGCHCGGRVGPAAGPWTAGRSKKFNRIPSGRAG